MSIAFEELYQSVSNWARKHGIDVQDVHLPAGKAGEFNGLAVAMNNAYDVEERAYYLVHALGSIVLWSLDKQGVQSMFDELRDAKENKESDATRFERAITHYRSFETQSSELAVWLLAELGYGDSVSPYTNFMRADLESMTIFHRRGVALVWREFFFQWNEEVTSGRKRVQPFNPKPVPPFVPIAIEKQEILQQQAAES